MPARQQLGGGGEAYVLAWHWRDAGVRERQSHDRYCLGTGPRARLREDRLERAAVSTSARHHDDAGYKLRTRRHDAGRTGPDADKPLPPSACCPDGRVMGMLSLRDTLALRLQE